MGRRILVTGLGSYWGGRVARALETRPDVDVVVGINTSAPRVALERTEYVRCPLRIVDLPPEGRRSKEAGFHYHCSTLGAVQAPVERQRLRHAVGAEPGYRYEAEVEASFRHSPAVVRPPS